MAKNRRRGEGMGPSSNGDVIKAVPKKGETPADAIARVQAAHPGKTVVDPPRGSNSGSSYQGRGARPMGSNALETFAREPTYPVGNSISTLRQPIQVLTMPDGGTTTTPYGRDPFRVNKTEAFIMEYPQVHWENFNNLGGTADPVAVAVEAKTQQIVGILLDTINYNGRFIPNQVLSAIADWTTFLNNYTVAFSILYSVLSLPLAANLNPSFRAFATALAGSGNIDRAVYDWKERLQFIPVPHNLPTWLSRLFGVFYSDAEDFAYVAHINTSAAVANVTDFTSASAISTLLGVAETALTACETTGAEAPIIHEILAVVYGVPPKLEMPQIHSSQCGFDLHFTHCVQVKDNTSGNFKSTPTPTSLDAGGVIPILRRRGNTDYDDVLSTVLRPAVYSFTTGAEGANTNSTGLCTFNNLVQNFGRYYGTNAAANNTILTDALAAAAFGTYNFNTPSFFESEWWFLADIESTAATALEWKQDPRSYDRWDEFYVSLQRFIGSTNKVLDQLFLTGLAIRTLR